MVGFLLVNKVYSPQYALWLLPLAVLARPRWRDQLVWQARRDLLLLRRSGGTSAATSTPAAAATPASTGWRSCVRVRGELYLVGIVVRDVLLPEYDVVRARRAATVRGGSSRPAARMASTADVS